MMNQSLHCSALVVVLISLSMGCGGSQLSEPSASLNQPDASSEIASTVAPTDQSSGGATSDPMDSDLDFNFDEEDTRATAPSETASAVRPAKTPVATASVGRRGSFESVTVVDKFPDGSFSHRWKEKRYEDGTKVRHGPYEESYENGQIFLAGQYADGERTEVWTYWHPNGQIAKRGRYVHGKSNGKWSFFGADGLLDREENYLQGKPHGMFKSWQQEGKLAAEVRYENGERK